MKDTYNSIVQAEQAIIKEKGSRFLAHAYPIQDASEVQPLVEALRAEHHAARHHCWAYRLGVDGESFRANDDGEPSGTAGRPILGQILSRDLSDILVVVVRYFGGTLLGVPGLIAAYKGATCEVLDRVEVVQKVLTDSLRVEFEYGRMSAIMKVVKDMGCEILEMGGNSDRCVLDVSLKLSLMDELQEKLSKVNY